MPEGDTIHHAAARMRSVLQDRVPDRILTPHPRHAADRWPERLAGRAVRSVDAHGKHLFVRFEGELTLHSHLRMTGAWGVHREGARWKRSARRAWLVIRSGDWSVVQFDGPVLELMRESRTRLDRRLAALGQDVIGESFDERRFLARLRGADPARAIGDALLDQGILAGIGNVWKSESCFAASLNPWRPLGARGRRAGPRSRSLRASANAPVGGRRRLRSRPREVYGRAGMPCPRCGASIREHGQGDGARLTYWCPGCQR